MHGELATLARIREGYSLSRIGDGELKVMDGHGYSREPENPKLSKEIRLVASKPSQRCLVGIPTMDPKGSKYRTISEDGTPVGWFRHKERFCKFLSPDVEYYSALITRPDCGEWMLTVEYAKEIQSIWLGKRVAVIGSADNKIHKAVEMTQPAIHIECPYREAYREIDNLEAAALAVDVDIVLICAGVTATCLANRLSPRVQAVDLGSVGGFMCKMLGAEKWNTD